MEDQKQDKGFVIKDRRHFDESGTARQEEQARPQEPRAQAGGDPADQPPPPREEPEPPPGEGPLPAMDFSGFIFSLSTTALYHFGDFPDPVTKEARRNLPAAKQTIDILSMLKTKTEGNLDAEEKQFLESILYELRMRYVKEMGRP
jgi:hypothetical protein